MRKQLAWWLLLFAGLVVQSSLLPLLLPDAWRPDITRSLVLWAALTGVPRGPVPAFLAGLGLDVASGSPLGFGAALRLVLYGLARPFRGIFFDDHPILLLPVAVLATLTDAFAAWVMSWVALPSPFPFSAVAGVAWRQSLAESVAVPLVFLALELLSGRKPLLPVRSRLTGGLVS